MKFSRIVDIVQRVDLLVDFWLFPRIRVSGTISEKKCPESWFSGSRIVQIGVRNRPDRGPELSKKWEKTSRISKPKKPFFAHDLFFCTFFCNPPFTPGQGSPGFPTIPNRNIHLLEGHQQGDQLSILGFGTVFTTFLQDSRIRGSPDRVSGPLFPRNSKISCLRDIFSVSGQNQEFHGWERKFREFRVWDIIIHNYIYKLKIHTL